MSPPRSDRKPQHRAGPVARTRTPVDSCDHLSPLPANQAGSRCSESARGSLRVGRHHVRLFGRFGGVRVIRLARDGPLFRRAVRVVLPRPRPQHVPTAATAGDRHGAQVCLVRRALARACRLRPTLARWLHTDSFRMFLHFASISIARSSRCPPLRRRAAPSRGTLAASARRRRRRRAARAAAAAACRGRRPTARQTRRGPSAARNRCGRRRGGSAACGRGPAARRSKAGSRATVTPTLWPLSPSPPSHLQRDAPRLGGVREPVGELGLQVRLVVVVVDD